MNLRAGEGGRDAATGRMAGIVTTADALGAYLRRDDEILDDVRREIICGAFTADACDVRVNVLAGIVMLTGDVRRRTVVPDLVRAVQRVEGVVCVEQHLSAPALDRFPVPRWRGRAADGGFGKWS